MKASNSDDVIQWFSGPHDESIQFVYDYTELIIEPYQVFKTFDLDGYLRVSFHPDLKMFSPQLFFSNSSAQMNTYFVSAIDIVLVPEAKIVIENTPITNGAPIYIHIPLKYQKGEPNGIDQLLKRTSDTINLNLNAIFNNISGKTACAYFKGQSILYTQTPIYINTQLDRIKNALQPMVNSTMLNKNAKYTIVYLSSKYVSTLPSNSQSVREGFEINGDVYECTTLDDGGEAVSEFVQVPLFSSSTGTQTSLSMMQAIVYMFYLAIIVLFCVTVIPLTYESLILAENKSLDIQKDIACLEVFIPLSFLLGSLGLIIEALNQVSSSLLNAGQLLTFLMICISFTIFFYRLYSTNFQNSIGFLDRLKHFINIFMDIWFNWLVIFGVAMGIYAILVWGLQTVTFSTLFFMYGTCFSLGVTLVGYALNKVFHEVIKVKTN